MEDEDDVQDVEIEEPAAATGEEGEGGEGKAEGGVNINIKVHVAEQQLPLVGMFFAAIVLLISVTTYYYRKNYAYGVSVAAVAMVFSFIGLLLTKKEDLNAKIGKYNNYFLFLWCFVGSCVLTFNGPFLRTSNGYFSAWGLTFFSIMGLGVSGEGMKSAVSGIGSLLGLVASSIIVIIAIPTYLGGFYNSESIFALVVACITIPVVGFFVNEERDGSDPAKFKFPVLAFFAVLWIVLACLLTFRGPFLDTGNGYFGSWAGAATSVFAAMTALKKE